MNTNESISTETEKPQPEQDEVRRTPPLWIQAPDPEIKRDFTEPATTESKGAAAPEVSLPQYSSELSFACVLIPRFSDHYLVGDIVDCLSIWMNEICISYGWRLESVSMRPGYMQWVMRVPLNANPAQFMKLVRRHTSARIFEDFPRFKQKNLSGEFWAPGNFVVPENQQLTPDQVNSFIVQTRTQQGMV